MSKKRGKFEQPRKGSAQTTHVEGYPEQDLEQVRGPVAYNGDGWEEPRPKRNWKKIGLITLAGVAAAACIGIGVFLWIFSRDDGLIFDNVYALDLCLSGMTQEQAAQALEEKAVVFETPLTVTLQDRSLVLTPENTGVRLDAQALAQAAYNYGREGNMFDRARARSAAVLTTCNLEVGEYLELDTTYIRDAVDQLGAQIESQLIQPSVTVTGQRPDLSHYALAEGDQEPGESEDVTYIDPEEPCYVEGGQVMTLTAGVPGRHLDTEALYRRILDAYSAGDLSGITLTYDEQQPDPVDPEALYQEYCLAPVDSVMDETTYVASQESLGYGFVPEELQEQLDDAQEGQELQVEFRILVPAATKYGLEKDLFRDVLSTSQTNHTWNNNRTRNLELACEAIDGYIVKPGDIFSFNEVVGERTAAKGYKEATVYSGMQSVEELGGGVCQVASTLYVCTLYADLEVVERTCHTFDVTYVPRGLDATVYWGYLDYKFRNNTDYPIRIDASVHDGYVDISFVGTETKDYYIKMRSETTSSTDWKTVEKEITDGSYKDGEVITTPYTGYTANSYKQKWDRATDTMISEEFEAHSEYSVRDKVIARVPAPTQPTTPPTTAPTEPPATEPPETDPPETEPPVTDPEPDPGA